MEMKYDKRGSGRTTKMLRDVLAKACSGKYCIVIVADGNHANNLMSNLERLSAEIGISFDTVNGVKIYIGNKGGSVSLIPIACREVDPIAMKVIGSHPDCETYVDHYAVMSYYPQILAAFHRWD